MKTQHFLKNLSFSFLILGTSLSAASHPTKVERSVPSVSLADRVVDSGDSGISEISLASLKESETLQMFVGKSLVVSSASPLTRVSVTDPEIATIQVLSPQQVLIHSKAPGVVTLLLWGKPPLTYSFELEVLRDIQRLQSTLSKVFPQESVQVMQSGVSLVVSGSVSSPEVAERIVALVQTEAENVVNLMQTDKHDEVLLQVRFAEVNRAAIQRHGIDIFSTGAGNTPGVITTQQHGSVLGNLGAVPAGVERGSDPKAPNLVSGGIGNQLKRSPTVFGLSDLMNIFLFRPDLNLGVTVRSLQQQNLLEILAEPNLLAIDGQEASFLAGGEFPFPVVQGGANFAVSIQFKEFGVRLTFLPRILKNGKIRLKVAPEVSSLDFSNGLSLSGFLVPALSTRRAKTEIELADGQSFAIAGLIDNRLTEVASKVPGLGDIPFIGRLFQSHSLKRTNSELLVMVTPRLVKPLPVGHTPDGPDFPSPFLDREEFDEEHFGKGSEE